MSLFLSHILLPTLMREAGMYDQESTLNRRPSEVINGDHVNSRFEKLQNNDKYNCRLVEDDDDEDDSYWLNELEENSPVKKNIVENEHKFASLEDTKLREKSLKKPDVVELGEDSVELSEHRKRKRKSSNKKKTKKMNKKKHIYSPSQDHQETPPLPIEFKNAILVLAQGKCVSEEKLVIQKRLFGADVDNGQGRLTIPVNQMGEDFLTEEEKIVLTKYVTKGRKESIKVKIIEPLMLKQGIVYLRNWVLKKPSGRSSMSYVLNGTWGEISKNNNLKEGDVVQLWAVRVDAELCFALVKL